MTTITRRTASSGLSILTVSSLSAHPSPSSRSLLVVVAPGYTCRASDFNEVTTRLSTQSQTQSDHYNQETYISIDFPGTGETSLTGFETPTITSFGSLLNQVKDEFLANQTQRRFDVVLAGHSMGVRVALEAFRQEPTGVTGIMLIDGSNYRLRGKEYLKQQLKTFAEQLPGAAQTQEQKDAQEAAVDVLFNNMFTSHTPEEFRQVAIRDGKRNVSESARLRRSHIQWDGEMMDDTVDLAARECIPVLVLQATDAKGPARVPLSPGEETEWMGYLKRKLGAQYTGVTLDGLGHFPHVDGPGRVAEATRMWLDTRIVGM